MKCASFFYKNGIATDDALQQILKVDILALSFSILIVLSLSLAVIYIVFSNLCCLTTALFISSTVLVPYICTAGIFSMAGLSLLPTTIFIPFLLLGKSTSDIALFLGEWRRQNIVHSLDYRVTSCIARVGTVQLFSTFCATILLGIAIKSSFEVTSEFFLVTVIAFALASVASFLIAPTLTLSLERQLKTLNTFCMSPRTKISSFLQGKRERVHNVIWYVTKNLPRPLTSFGGKVISFILLVCFISICVSSALQTSQRTFSTENLYQENDNFIKFHEAQKKFFGKQTDVSIVFSGRTDYPQKTIQEEMLQICGTLGKASYSQERTVCWLSALLKNKSKSCTNLKFRTCLHKFLNQSQNLPFRRDVLVDEKDVNFPISASRYHVKMVVQKTVNENKGNLEKLREDLKVSLKPKPVSQTLLKAEDLSSLERETVLFLIIVTAVAFGTCFLSSSSLSISIFLTLTFDLLPLEAAAIMEIWSIQLNHLAFIALYLTVVLAHNFSVQIAHSFIYSDKQIVRERMNKALESVGLPVFMAAFLEISGSVSLGLIYPSLQDIFFRLIPVVFALGLIHALVILPPIVTLFFELMDSFDFQNMLPNRTNQKRRKMSIQIRYGGAPQATSRRPPISIVGISYRFPGANSKEMFWNLLVQGKSSIREFPQK